MKILHIITGLGAGGAERMLYKLLWGGLDKHFNNKVISLSDEGVFGSYIRKLNVHVSTLGIRRKSIPLAALRELRRLIRNFQPDVIQGWMYHGNGMAWLGRYLAPGKPALVWNIRQSLYGLEFEKPITRQIIRVTCWLSNTPETILYNSRISRNQHEAFGFCSSSGQVIPNGFELRKFGVSGSKSQAIRDQLGILRNVIVVGHVARFHPMKDHANFLRAAALLVKKYNNVHFLMTGREVIKENKALFPLVSNIPARRLHLLGERQDIGELMAAMDVFCQSSWSEAFPNVLGEAMATGVPCVATDVGDSRDIIGDTGIMVRPRDEEVLAAALERIIVMPPKERHALGAAARARIESNYSLPAVVDQYVALYKKLTNKA